MAKKFPFVFVTTLFFASALNAMDAVEAVEDSVPSSSPHLAPVASPIVGFINQAFKERHKLSKKMWDAEEPEQWPEGFLETLWPQIEQALISIRDFLLSNPTSATFEMFATGAPDENDLPGLEGFLDEIFTSFKTQAEGYLREKTGAIVYDYMHSEEEASASSSPVTLPTFDDDLGIFDRFLENRKKSFQTELNKFVSTIRNIQIFGGKKPLARNFGTKAIRWEFIAGELITDIEMLTTYLIANKMIELFANHSLLPSATTEDEGSPSSTVSQAQSSDGQAETDEDEDEASAPTDSESYEELVENCAELLGLKADGVGIDHSLLKDLIDRFLQLQKQEKTLAGDDGAIHDIKVKQQEVLNAIAKTFDVLRSWQDDSF